MPKPKIPEAAIKRLPIYLRVLEESVATDVQIISSAELAEKTGLSPEQIRKDLAYFGAFGTRGVGYDTAQLARRISRILGIHQGVEVALVGAGSLGFALARYSISRRENVRITAIFDTDPRKIGADIMGVQVRPLSDLNAVVQAQGIKLAILAVPVDEAQYTAELLHQAGIEAILNFAPAKLRLDGGVVVHNIDLTIELQSLAYHTTGGEEEET